MPASLSHPRLLVFLAAALCLAPALAPPAAAASHRGIRPTELGTFSAWIAATYGHGHDRICYVFTRANDRRARVGPMLSVTDRPTGRNQVAISGGPLFSGERGALVQVGETSLDFYTSGRDAFARYGRAAVVAFERGATAELRLPGKDAYELRFSLSGFTAADDAMRKACPAR